MVYDYYYFQYLYIKTYLKVLCVKTLLAVLLWLMGIDLIKYLPRTKPTSHPNRTNFEVDQTPIIEKRETLDYKQLIQEHLQNTGQQLKPVRRTKNSTKVKTSITCPHCNAPSDYIYHNNGGRGQYLCKICHNTFFEGIKLKSIQYRCPHCTKKLQIYKVRKGYIIHKCVNTQCPYRLKKIRNLTPEQKHLRKEQPWKVKVAYFYREANFDLTKLHPATPDRPTIDLARAHSTPNVIGLTLTFFVNLSLSARETSTALKEIFNVSLSHQTVLNYAEAAAYRLQPLTSDTTIEVSGSICGDETYIRISGTWGYVIFIYCPSQCLLVTSHVCLKRDTLAATTALYNAVQKFCPNLLDDPILEPLFVSDGNPIYQLAVSFLKQHGYPLEHKTVIGLQNLDPESTEYRTFKQFIERVHRTYKQKIHKKGGFKSLDGAVVFTILFTIWFNYLRSHQSLGGLVPIQLPELVDCQLLPQKWGKLLELTQKEYQEN
jgi:putative transposase